MNSQLRTVLQSANTAALVSFLVGTVALIGLLLATRAPLPDARHAGVGAGVGLVRRAHGRVLRRHLHGRGIASSARPACWGWRCRAAGHGAGRRSLRLAGAAGTSDYPYSPGGRSLAGRGRLADHALRTVTNYCAPLRPLTARKEGLCELTNYPGISIVLRRLAAVLLPAAIVYSHPDVMGTRFVAAERHDDAGDCDDNHHPCRTLHYALTQVEPGNAIKLAAGSYDVSGIDVENLLHRQGRRARRLFGRRSLRHPERRDQSHARLRRGRRVSATTSSRTASSWWTPTAIRCRASSCRNPGAHRLHQRPRGQLSLPQHRLSRAGAAAGNSHRSPPARARSGGSSISTTTASTPSSAIAMARRSTT